MKTKNLSRNRAELLLAGVIIARATSYLFSRLILKGMGVFNLLGVRFILGFVLLSVLFLPRLKNLNRKWNGLALSCWRLSAPALASHSNPWPRVEPLPKGLGCFVH